MTQPDGPVSVTVAVPVSGGDDTIEVIVTLAARRVQNWPDDGGEEPLPDPEPVPSTPSAVFGRNGIQGVATRAN